MHELPVTEGILRTVLPAAEKAGAKKILRIRLKVGALSGVVPECLQIYLDQIGEGTLAEGARIISEVTPAVIKCRLCGYAGPIARGQHECPGCKSPDFQITGGWEVTVDSLEAE